MKKSKRKLIRNSSIILGLSAAIVAVPTIATTLTASNANNEMSKMKGYGDGNGLDNYDNAGSKNNETLNFDDIINNIDNASLKNPVYAFDENDNMIVPKINKTFLGESKINEIEKIDFRNLNLDKFQNEEDLKNLVNVDELKKTFDTSKQDTKKLIYNKLTPNELQQNISLNTEQKKWINYMFPTNRLDMDNEQRLDLFLEDFIDQLYEEGEKGNIDYYQTVNSISAFGIDLDKEFKNFENSADSNSYIDSLNKILNNNGSINNNLKGGGGSSPSKPSNPGGGITDAFDQVTGGVKQSLNVVQMDGSLELLVTLHTLSITICSIQIIINGFILFFSFGSSIGILLLDILLSSLSITSSSRAIRNYLSTRDKLDYPILDILCGVGDLYLLKKANFEDFFNQDWLKNLFKKTNIFNDYFFNLNFNVRYFNGASVPKLTKDLTFIGKLKTSPIGIVLTVVNAFITILIQNIEKTSNKI